MRRPGDAVGYLDLDSIIWWDGSADLNGDETWTFVAGHGSAYVVSTLGRVARVTGGRGARPGRILKPVPDQKGQPHEHYMIVRLSHEGKKATRKVHRLVALAFMPSEHKWCDVHHLNHDRTDNRLCNLEWQDSEEHRQEAYREWEKHSRYRGRQYGRAE